MAMGYITMMVGIATKAHTNDNIIVTVVGGRIGLDDHEYDPHTVGSILCEC